MHLHFMRVALAVGARPERGAEAWQRQPAQAAWPQDHHENGAAANAMEANEPHIYRSLLAKPAAARCTLLDAACAWDPKQYTPKHLTPA